MRDMAGDNLQLASAVNRRQIVDGTMKSRWFSVAARVVVLSFLVILRAQAVIAQSGTGAEDTKGLLSRGSIYYLGSFSSAKDLVPASGICGAFGLLGRPPVQLPEVA